MPDLVGAIDQGTTGTRFIVFDGEGTEVGSAYEEHRQIYPRPGWVEHDPAEIVERMWSVVERGLAGAGITAGDLRAVGITNQRETAVVWERSSGRPVANAVVWQDTRTDALCRELGGDAGSDRFREATGLPLATYFTGPKLRWLLDADPALRERAAAGELAGGTVDAWLVHSLTEGRVHATDPTNASRTLLMDLRTCSWDPGLCEEIGVPPELLPEIRPSVGVLGEATGPLSGVPLAGVLGDQQAALFGQTCFDQGDAKNTYGTGCFLLLNTGEELVHSRHGLITTVAYQTEGRAPVYALEGSVAVTGALVQWLRDNLGIIGDASEIEGLARSVEDNGDVYLVPAFAGLFAPRWRSDARGVVVGLTGFATRGHLARAALESTAFQTAEVVEAMDADAGVELVELRVDGGMTSNGLLMQFQADILGVPVIRPGISETTALGAAYAAGLATGLWGSFDDLRRHWREDRRWEPDMDPTARARLRARWDQAVERTFDWA